jgi:molybdopterin-guanine dinucleotide biosynthesis protein A
VLGDLHPGCGPLAGIEAACRRMKTSLLCVLAVDLPWMTAAFLARLVERAAHDGCGMVPQDGERFEPLAAVYPRAMLPLIEEHLSASDCSMQRLIRRAVELDLITPYPIAEEERALFRNINTPTDLTGI